MARGAEESPRSSHLGSLSKQLPQYFELTDDRGLRSTSSYTVSVGRYDPLYRVRDEPDLIEDYGRAIGDSSSPLGYFAI